MACFAGLLAGRVWLPLVDKGIRGFAVVAAVIAAVAGEGLRPDAGINHAGCSGKWMACSVRPFL